MTREIGGVLRFGPVRLHQERTFALHDNGEAGET